MGRRDSLRIVIVGAGIGGIAAAVALGREGFEPLVLEQAHELSEVGAGVALGRNGMLALAGLGVSDRVREVGVEAVCNVELDLETGKTLSEVQFEDGADTASLLQEVYVHRADLVEELIPHLALDRVRLNSRVIDVKPSGAEAIVRLETGEEICADVVVGADGLQSSVRTVLFGARPASFTGYVAWRALLDRDSATERWISLRGSVTWYGQNRHIVMYPVRRGTLLNIAAFVPADEVRRESWSAFGEVAPLLASFASAAAPVRRFLQRVDEAFLTSVYFRDPLPSWSVGRITLLGDAAHPMPPSAGQGASMALEDSVTLAVCLSRNGRDVATAFQAYERLRVTRTSQVWATSHSNLRSYTERDPVQIQARNSYLRGLEELGETTSSWMYQHDALTAAKTLSAEGRSSGRPEVRRAFDLLNNAIEPADIARGWRGERAAFERFMEREFPAPTDVTIHREEFDGVPGLVVGTGPGTVGLHLHGGRFIMGSALSAVELASRLSQAIAGPVVVPDYRLAPEHPYPAALSDVLAAYRWLKREYLGSPVVVTGEGAGGGLAVSLAITLRDAGESLPCGVQVVSPFCDLTLSGASIEQNCDPLHNRRALVTAAACYLGDASATDPLVSPLYGDLAGLPHLDISAAAEEAVADDARRVAQIAEEAGVNVTLTIEEGSVPSFVLFKELPEADRALKRVVHLTSMPRSTG